MVIISIAISLVLNIIFPTPEVHEFSWFTVSTLGISVILFVMLVYVNDLTSVYVLLTW